MTYVTTYVKYEEFGAKGDGVTDDFNAIKAAHEYANENNLPVCTKSDAVYYIGDAEDEILLMTDTDWNKSRFIIDDNNVSNRRLSIFKVVSNGNINEPCKKHVIMKNADIRHYIRLGLNQNNGVPQTDTIVVDSDGNVIVPPSWKFDNITSMKITPIDTVTLHITGGIFTTIANYDEANYKYYSRNISIHRSNVIIDGIEHYIENEREHGAPYTGFITASNCCDITVQNCFFTGHKIYNTIGAAGKPVSMGTYDVSFSTCVNVNLINCRQINIRDTGLWGVYTSNHCKNLTIDGCYISRVDAHMGVTNYTIKNTTLGWQGLNAIGHGLLTVDNVTSYSNGSLINLRSDYGSTWNGDVIIKNTKWHVNDRITNPAIIGGHNSGEHDFGYTCYLPQNIDIENLQVENVKGDLFIINKFADTGFKDKPYPYVMTKNIRCRNVTSDNGSVLKGCIEPDLIEGVNIIYN